MQGWHHLHLVTFLLEVLANEIGQGKIIKGIRTVQGGSKAIPLQVIPGKSKRINEKTNTNNKKFSKIPGYKINLQKSNINWSEDKME